MNFRVFCLSWILITFLVYLSAAIPGAFRQNKFYVASNGNDTNPGTRELPWKNLQKINDNQLTAGDTIFFARGSLFNGGLLIKDSGNAEHPIVLLAYGKGTAPTFQNFSHEILNGNMIQISGSYIMIDGLRFTAGMPAKAGNDPDVANFSGARQSGTIFINKGANYVTVKNCEIENCPMGIQSYGQFGKFCGNWIHDCTRPLSYPAWGPVGIMVAESHIEICHNRIENYYMLGGFFGADGGALEIDNEFIAKSDIEIHHNYSRNNEGFLEVINGDFQYFRIHHNISEDFQEFIFFWGGRDCIIENNTVLCTQPQNSRVRVVFSFHADSIAVVRNNIFVLSNGLQVFNGENVYEAFHYNQLHYNNLYYCIDGSQKDLIGKPAGKGEIIADPLFVDFTNRDLQLTAGSPAVDAGANTETKTDFDGHPIPFGKTFDMGAYEYVGKLFTDPAK